MKNQILICDYIINNNFYCCVNPDTIQVICKAFKIFLFSKDALN